MNPIQKIVKATLYLNKVNAKDGCVPDFAIKVASDNFGLTDLDCREIRDTVQEIHPRKM